MARLKPRLGSVDLGRTMGIKRVGLDRGGFSPRFAEERRWRHCRGGADARGRSGASPDARRAASGASRRGAPPGGHSAAPRASVRRLRVPPAGAVTKAAGGGIPRWRRGRFRVRVPKGGGADVEAPFICTDVEGAVGPRQRCRAARTSGSPDASR